MGSDTGADKEQAGVRAQETLARIRAQLAVCRASAVDAVYRKLDHLLLDARLVEAEAFLDAIAGSTEPEPMPLSILLSAMTAARPWRIALGVEVWTRLAERARQIAFLEGGDAKVAALSPYLDG